MICDIAKICQVGLARRQGRTELWWNGRWRCWMSMKIFFCFLSPLWKLYVFFFFFFFFWQNNTKTRWCGAKLMKDKCGFVVRLGIYSGTWYLLMFWPIWFLVCLMHVCRLLGGGVWICMLVGGVLVCTVYVVQVLGFVCGCWCLVQWWGYWFKNQNGPN